MKLKSSVASLLAATALSLTGCGGQDAADTPAGPAANSANASAPSASSTEPSATSEAVARWDFQSSGEGAALALMAATGRGADSRATIRLFCAAGQDSLLVNVPAFRPIGSEERLSFGSGGEVMALVADTRGDAQRGGVSGTAQVPDNLAALVAGPLSASYGAQRSGPHPAPPRDLSRGFVAACREGVHARRPPADSAGPCLMQGSERLRVTPLRAVGTEPFWSARIEGRCVTYSHPEDQDGTRVWTRYTAGPAGGTWSGALRGRPFQLRTRSQPGCSDGMSDKRYPLAVELIVDGENRTGCAEPR